MSSRQFGVRPEGWVVGALLALVVFSSVAYAARYSGSSTVLTSTSTAYATTTVTLPPSESSSATPPSSSETSSTSTISIYTSTPFNSSQAASLISVSLGNWVDDITKGYCCVASFYTNASTLSWYGDVPAPTLSAETLTGPSEISSLYSGFLRALRTSSPLLTVQNLTVTPQGGLQKATFDLIVNGTSASYGGVNATVSVTQMWGYYLPNYLGWVIQDDSWDFVMSHVEFTQPASEVRWELAEWQEALQNDSSNIGYFYDKPSTLTWYGNVTTGYTWQIGDVWGTGTFFNPSDSEPWGSSLAIFYPYLCTYSNLTIGDAGGGNFIATFHMTLKTTGLNFQTGNANASVNIKQLWTYSGGNYQWRIQTEYWGFQSAYQQSPISIA